MRRVRAGLVVVALLAAAGCSKSGHKADAGAGGGSGGGNSGGSGDGDTGDGGSSCGYQARGTPLHIAAGLDVCLPPVVCDPETCPPPLGQCSNGQCVYGAGYAGLATLPQAWATHYCQLTSGGCHGVTQIDFAEVTAQMIGAQLGRPLCETQPSDGCIGITATSARLVGNAQTAVDASGQPVKDWGLGLTEASGLCYRVTGPGGSALVAVTDRCGGYCKCNGSGFQECGPCVNAASLTPNCPCVGSAGALYPGCCGRTCGGPIVAECDWCASNNHAHFDLDDGTFDFVCGGQANLGSCQLSAVAYVPCLGGKSWPPQ